MQSRQFFLYGKRVDDFDSKKESDEDDDNNTTIISPESVVELTFSVQSDIGPTKKFLCEPVPQKQNSFHSENLCIPDIKRKLLAFFTYVSMHPSLGLVRNIDYHRTYPVRQIRGITGDTPHRIIKVFHAKVLDPVTNETKGIRFHFATYLSSFSWNLAMVNYFDISRWFQNIPPARQAQELTRLRISHDCNIRTYLFAFPDPGTFIHAISIYLSSFSDQPAILRACESTRGLWTGPQLKLKQSYLLPLIIDQMINPELNEGADILKDDDKNNPTDMLNGNQEARAMIEYMFDETKRHHGLKEDSTNIIEISSQLIGINTFFYTNLLPMEFDMSWTNNNSPQHIEGTISNFVRNPVTNQEPIRFPYAVLQEQLETFCKSKNVTLSEAKNDSDIIRAFEDQFRDDSSNFKCSLDNWISDSVQNCELTNEVFSMQLLDLNVNHQGYSLFANSIINLIQLIELSCDMRCGHLKLFEYIILDINVKDQTEFNPEHRIEQGPASAGKSYAKILFASLMIPGGVITLDRETAQSVSFTQQMDDSVLINDEPPQFLQHNPYQKDSSHEQEKTALSSGYFVANRPYKDPVTKELVMRKEYARLKCVRIINSNKALEANMELALQSRFYMSNTLPRDRPQQKWGVRDEGLRKRLFQQLQYQLRRISAIAYIVHAMTAAGLLPTLDTKVEDKVVSEVTKAMGEKFGETVLSPREKVMHKKFTKGLCYFAAISHHFKDVDIWDKNTNSFDFRKIYGISRYLFVTQEMVMMSISALPKFFGVHDYAYSISKYLKEAAKLNLNGFCESSLSCTDDRGNCVGSDSAYYGFTVKINYETNAKLLNVAELINRHESSFDTQGVYSFLLWAQHRHLLSCHHQDDNDAISENFNLPNATTTTRRPPPRPNVKKPVIRFSGLRGVGILKSFVDAYHDGEDRFLDALVSHADEYEEPRKCLTLIRHVNDQHLTHLLRTVELKPIPNKKTTIFKSNRLPTGSTTMISKLQSDISSEFSENANDNDVIQYNFERHCLQEFNHKLGLPSSNKALLLLKNDGVPYPDHYLTEEDYIKQPTKRLRHE